MLREALSPVRRQHEPATGFGPPRNFLKPEILAALFKLFCRILIFSTKMFKQSCKELEFQKVSSGTRPRRPVDVRDQATGFEPPGNFLKPEILAALFKLFCRILIFSTKMFKQCCKELGFQKVSSGTRPRRPVDARPGSSRRETF